MLIPIYSTMMNHLFSYNHSCTILLFISLPFPSLSGPRPGCRDRDLLRCFRFRFRCQFAGGVPTPARPESPTPGWVAGKKAMMIQWDAKNEAKHVGIEADFGWWTNSKFFVWKFNEIFEFHGDKNHARPQFHQKRCGDVQQKMCWNERKRWLDSPKNMGSQSKNGVVLVFSAKIRRKNQVVQSVFLQLLVVLLE